MGKNEVLKRKYGFLNPMIRTGSLVVGKVGVVGICLNSTSCKHSSELCLQIAKIEMNLNDPTAFFPMKFWQRTHLSSELPYN